MENLASISQGPTAPTTCGGLFGNKTIYHGIKIIIQNLGEQHILLRKESGVGKTGEGTQKEEKENKRIGKQ